jgi:hypothetical protein
MKTITPQPATLEVGMTEADFSDKHLGASGAIIISAWITHKDNGAMTSLDLANNNIGTIVMSDGWQYDNDTNEYWKKVDGAEQVSKDLPEGCGPLGVIAVANAIKDMRAISSLNLLKNDMGTDQAKALVSILKEHPTLKSLCGNKGDETELDMSGKMKGAADAIMLVPEIIDNGAMTSLNVSNNSLGVAAGWAFSSGRWWLNGNYPPGHSGTNPCSQLPAAGSEVSGVILLADTIKNNGALTKIDLSRNNIPSDQEGRLQRICEAGATELAI